MSEERREPGETITSEISLQHPSRIEKPKTHHTEMLSGTSYATDVGLLWHGFYDNVKEAVGDRILLYWKLYSPIFQQTNH